MGMALTRRDWQVYGGDSEYWQPQRHAPTSDSEPELVPLRALAAGSHHPTSSAELEGLCQWLFDSSLTLLSLAVDSQTPRC